MLLNCGVGEDSLWVPWTLKRYNQSILKEIIPEYPLEGKMLKLKLQYFGHLVQRTNSLERPWCWERSKAGGEGDDRGWDGWVASLIQWTWIWLSFLRWWRTGKPGFLWSCGLLVPDQRLNPGHPAVEAQSQDCQGISRVISFDPLGNELVNCSRPN